MTTNSSPSLALTGAPPIRNSSNFIPSSFIVKKKNNGESIPDPLIEINGLFWRKSNSICSKNTEFIYFFYFIFLKRWFRNYYLAFPNTCIHVTILWVEALSLCWAIHQRVREWAKLSCFVKFTFSVKKIVSILSTTLETLSAK